MLLTIEILAVVVLIETITLITLIKLLKNLNTRYIGEIRVSDERQGKLEKEIKLNGVLKDLYAELKEKYES